MFHVSLKCRKMSFDHRRASARGRVWSHTFNYVPTTGRVHSWVTLGRLSTISLNGLYTFFCLRIFRSLTKWRNRMKRKLRQSQPLLTWYQYQKRRMCVKRKMSLKQVARHDCRHHQHHRQSNTERRACVHHSIVMDWALIVAFVCQCRARTAKRRKYYLFYCTIHLDFFSCLRLSPIFGFRCLLTYVTRSPLLGSEL